MKTKNQNYRTKLKIVFLGTPRIAQIVLKKLIATKFTPQLVITGHDRNLGRGQALVPTSVKLEAQKSNIEVGYRVSDLDKSFDIAVLVAYGQIIPKAILELPKFGFLNIHPSLLPKYRGPSPIQSAILQGEAQTGVTIIKLDSELDHGPMLSQKMVKIADSDTTKSLTEKLGKIGADLLIELLPSYMSAEIKIREQDHSKTTWTEKITKEDGYIDLANPPDPQKLNRMIRAFYPWPTVWSKVKVKSAEPKIIKFLPSNILTQQPTDPFLIQPEGKRPLTIGQFRNGYPNLYDQIKPILENPAQS